MRGLSLTTQRLWNSDDQEWHSKTEWYERRRYVESKCRRGSVRVCSLSPSNRDGSSLGSLLLLCQNNLWQRIARTVLGQCVVSVDDR